MTFTEYLKNKDIDSNTYLKIAKKTASNTGYNPKLLTFSQKPKYKLNYDGTDFGASGYNDFILYKLLESKSEVSEGTSNKKRNSYRSRAKSTTEQTNNKYSKASLSFYILW